MPLGPDEKGSKNEIDLRLGFGVDKFGGVDREHDPASIADFRFYSLYNTIHTGGAIKNRGGQRKAHNVGIGPIEGIIDASDIGAPAYPGGGSSDSGIPSRIFQAQGFFGSNKGTPRMRTVPVAQELTNTRVGWAQYWLKDGTDLYLTTRGGNAGVDSGTSEYRKITYNGTDITQAIVGSIGPTVAPGYGPIAAFDGKRFIRSSETPNHEYVYKEVGGVVTVDHDFGGGFFDICSPWIFPFGGTELLTPHGLGAQLASRSVGGVYTLVALPAGLDFCRYANTFIGQWSGAEFNGKFYFFAWETADHTKLRIIQYSGGVNTSVRTITTNGVPNPNMAVIDGILYFCYTGAGGSQTIGSFTTGAVWTDALVVLPSTTAQIYQIMKFNNKYYLIGGRLSADAMAGPWQSDTDAGDGGAADAQAYRFEVAGVF